MEKMTEQELIVKCINEDSESKGMLYTIYAPILKRICKRYAGNEDVAEDWLHDSFIKIYTSLDTFSWQGKGSLQAWMARIVRNYCVQQLREQIVFEELMEGKDVCCEEMDEAEISETVLIGLLSQLPAKQRLIFNMYAIDKMTHKQIADALGINEKSSSSEYSRAKKKLTLLIMRYRQKQKIRIVLASVISTLILVGFMQYIIFKLQGIKTNENYHTHKKLQSPKLVTDDDEAQELTHKTPVSITKPMSSVKKVAIYSISVPSDSVSNAKSSTDSLDVEMDSVNILQKEQNTSPIEKSQLANSMQIVEDDSIHYVELESNKKHRNKWHFGVGGAINREDGGFELDDEIGSPNPEKPADGNDKKHILNKMPASANNDNVINTFNHRSWNIGFSLQRNITKSLLFDTGINYTHLTSNVEFQNGMVRVQHVQYLGIPIRLAYNFAETGNWRLYTVAGGMVETCVDARIGGRKYDLPKLQVSAQVGIGIQYDITPHFGLYAEPVFKYYIPNDSQFQTYRTVRPFSFTIGIGVRVK